MDPIQCAHRGDVEFFRQVDSNILQNANQKEWGSVLTIAAVNGHLNCCEVIYKRCPSLLYHRNDHGKTALHLAASNGRPEVIKFLLSVAAVTQGEKLLTMRDKTGLTALYEAVNFEHREAAKSLLEADTDNSLLGMVSTDDEGNSALHVAVKKQNFGIVSLLVEADPSCDYCANASGETPLWIAFENALTGNQTAVEIRKLLTEKQPSQCKVRKGSNEWTLLHHASAKGDLSAIEDIVHVCPDCLELVDKENRNFLHLATKFEHVNVVKYIMGIRSIAANVLNGRDIYGDTPLHIAALSANTSMVLSLLYDPRVNKTAVNDQGQKAIDMINFDYDKRKAGVYGIRVNEKEIKEQSDFDLLVGALIAAVSFTAGITVPGGYISDGPNKGTAILAKKTSFKLFGISNTIALLLSLYAVFSHFCTKQMIVEKDIIYQLTVARFCSLAAIFAMVIAFITGSYTVLAATDGYAITICVLCSSFFIFSFRPLWKMVNQYRRSIP